jgi:hypothetical protein
VIEASIKASGASRIVRFPQDGRIAGHGELAGIDKAIAAQDRPQSQMFEALARELLRQGNEIRFQARGASMSPAICDGEIVLVKPAVLAELRAGDIVLAKAEMGFRLHRLMIADYERDVYITRGDCGQQDDPAVSAEQIVGVARAKEVRVGQKTFAAKFSGARGGMLRSVARGQHAVEKVWTTAMPGWLRALASSSPDNCP